MAVVLNFFILYKIRNKNPNYKYDENHDQIVNVALLIAGGNGGCSTLLDYKGNGTIEIMLVVRICLS